MQFNFRKNFEFLDKRDENELILKYSATKKSSELCNFVIEKNLNANKSLRKLIDSHLDSKLVDLYFHKLLLAEFENCGLDALSNKLIIKDYDNKKNNNKLILKIFLSKNILKDINLFYGKKIIKFNYFFAIP